MTEVSTVQGTAWPIFVHSLRTAIACVVSLLVARLFRLPEAYWAPITTVVITQSSLGAALAVSWHRFLGTVLGALVGAAMAAQPRPDLSGARRALERSIDAGRRTDLAAWPSAARGALVAEVEHVQRVGELLPSFDDYLRQMVLPRGQSSIG